MKSEDERWSYQFLVLENPSFLSPHLLPLTNPQFLILDPLILLFHYESFFKFWKANLGFSDGPTNDGEIPLTNTTKHITSNGVVLFKQYHYTDHKNSLVTIELINPFLSMPSRRMSLLLCHLPFAINVMPTYKRTASFFYLGP